MSNSTPKLAFDLDRDVRVLAAMASSLTPYLYENEVYGRLSGSLPALTLGGLLMRLYRLTRLGEYLDPGQQATVRDAATNFEADRSQWAAHFEQKVAYELRSRLDALDKFARECVDDPASCATAYPTQAEKRTMIEHLVAEANANGQLESDLATRVGEVDRHLRQILRDGEFVIADDRLRQVYPPERFWWLYSQMLGT